MKKAKVMLTAITVLAVVGGALAFKAKIANTTLFTHQSGTLCNGPSARFLTTTIDGGGTQFSASTTDGGTCVAFYTLSE